MSNILSKSSYFCQCLQICTLNMNSYNSDRYLNNESSRLTNNNSTTKFHYYNIHISLLQYNVYCII